MVQPVTSRSVPEDTRTRLLDGAAEVFAEKGYANASMDDVAAAAGMTKGALYWNFDSKEALFHTLLEERIYAPLRALVEFTRTADTDTSTADQAGAVMAALQAQPGLLRIGYEHWLGILGDPQRRGEQADLWRTMRDALAESLHARAEHLGAPTAGFDAEPEQIATAYIALAHGLAIWRLLDPDVADDQLYALMTSLIYEGLVARALGQVPEEHRGRA
jgi:AcrR family transcriptional regulator